MCFVYIYPPIFHPPSLLPSPHRPLLVAPSIIALCPSLHFACYYALMTQSPDQSAWLTSLPCPTLPIPTSINLHSSLPIPYPTSLSPTKFTCEGFDIMALLATKLVQSSTRPLTKFWTGLCLVERVKNFV